MAIEHDKDNIHITMKCSFVDELKIENIYDDVALNGVKTVLTLRKDEKLWTYTRQSFLHDDESVKAGTNRLDRKSVV